MAGDVKKREWEASYAKRDNFLFHPNEEVIRFVSKHIRKRIGLDEWLDTAPTPIPMHPRVLDVGCGIGRHLIFAKEMNFDPYGIDLSQEAVSIAREWLHRAGMNDAHERVTTGTAQSLPWEDGFFDYALSHGVLDSMPFEVARQAVAETARVLKPKALFYCDLISGDDSAHDPAFDGEETRASEHEKGTLQSYFNRQKIERLLEGRLNLLDCLLIHRTDAFSGRFEGRWHVVGKKP